MKIEVTRKVFQAKATISDLLFISNDNAFLCNVLEDVDRGLSSTDPINKISQVKIAGRTAIPYGEYRLVLDYSNRFKKIMPHILNVPGFEGVRIHVGNSSIDTEGCLLLGEYYGGQDFIRDSGVCFDMFMDIIQRATDRNENIWITIKK
jgi:hypothetical protein